jgi:hypothetical protein
MKLIFFLILLPFNVFSQILVNSPNTPVFTNFDLTGVSNCTATLAWTDNVTILGCYTNKLVYNYSTGCSNNGGIHLSGISNETAFGARSSGSNTNVKFGVRYKNNTGLTITKISISFNQEQWGNANTDSTNIILSVANFDYSISPTILGISSVVTGNNPSLSLRSLTPFGLCPTNMVAIPGGLQKPMFGVLNVNLLPGDEILLRWTYLDTPCNNNPLLIDDLSVSFDVEPLPITLSLFKGSYNNNTNNIDLYWLVDSQINNVGYYVQKLINNSFQNIGFVEGLGSTIIQQECSFSDPNVDYNQVYYYRLVQYDYDGQYEIFNPISVRTPTIFVEEEWWKKWDLLGRQIK